MQEICANTFHINVHKSRTETGPSEKYHNADTIMKGSKFGISFEKLVAIYLINPFCFKKEKLIHKRNYQYIMLEFIRTKQAPSMNRETKENIRVEKNATTT